MMCTYNADRVERLLKVMSVSRWHGLLSSLVSRVSCRRNMECRLCWEMTVRISVWIKFVHFCKNHVVLCVNKTKFNVFSHIDKCLVATSLCPLHC